MLFIVFALMLVSVFYSYVFWKKSKPFELGFSAAGNYFLILPGLFLIFNEVLPVPVDFFGTQIPAVHFDNYKYEVIAVFVSWVLINQINLLLSTIKFSKGKLASLEVSESLFFRLFVLYEVLAFLLFFASGLGGGNSHWARGKEEFMHSTGVLGLILVFLVSGLRYSLVALASYTLFKKEKQFVAILVLVACSITDLYTTGNRITMLLVVFCIMYFLLMRRYYKTIFLVLVLAIPFGWFMVIFRFIRSQLHSEGSILEGFSKGLDVAENMLDFKSGVIFEFMSGISESVNFNVLIGVYRTFGESVGFLFGGTYWKAVVWWIPRSLYELKPETITVEAARVFAPYEDVSLVTTALGESFANFGYFSVFFLPVLLLGFRGVVEKIYVSNEYSNFVKLIYGFLLFRMAFSDLFIYMLFGGLLVLVFNFNYKLRGL